MKKRLLSLLLVLAMVFSLMPAALAADKPSFQSFFESVPANAETEPGYPNSTNKWKVTQLGEEYVLMSGGKGKSSARSTLQLTFTADAELTFEPKALEAIADKAIERKIGARGLRAVMEGLLMNVMYDIPSDRTIDRVTITPGCVEGTEQPKISHRTEKEGEAPQPSLPADSAS